MIKDQELKEQVLDQLLDYISGLEDDDYKSRRECKEPAVKVTEVESKQVPLSKMPEEIRGKLKDEVDSEMGEDSLEHEMGETALEEELEGDEHEEDEEYAQGSDDGDDDSINSRFRKMLEGMK